MKTLGRNADNDLYLEAGELAVLHDADAQCAIIESVLQTQRGELQFDEDGGIDYFGTVLQNPNYISFWAGQVTSRIESLDFVSSVENFEYRFDKGSSTLYWSMTVINTDDERLDLQNKKLVFEGSPGTDVSWNDIYDKPVGVDETLSLADGMRDEARDVDLFDEQTRLIKVKDAINKVLFEPADPKYSATREIVFKFSGVPLGTTIDFSNVVLGIKNTGSADREKYLPFTVKISDGTEIRNTHNYDETALSSDGNTIWFPSEGTTPPSQQHTITEVGTRGTVTLKLIGDITSLKKVGSGPIFLLSNGKPFPYVSEFSVGERVPLNELGDNCFSGFRNLHTIKWSSSVDKNASVSIGKYAFKDCSSITSLEWMPNNVISIGDGCFSGCSSISSLEGLVVGDTTRKLPNDCFSGCGSLISLAGIPSSVDELGEHAFSNCSSLKTIDELPDGITKIGKGCFSGCSSLETILYMPESLSEIGDGAFENCSSLRSVFIPILLPSNLSSSKIGAGAFALCPLLTNVMFEGGSPTFTGNIFESTDTVLYVPVGSKSGYESVFPENEIHEYGSIEFKLEGVHAGATILGTTGIIESDSIWQVEYTGCDEKPKRFESSVTALPEFVYSSVPVTDSESGTSNIIVKGFVKRLSAISDSLYPILSIDESGSNTLLTSVVSHLETSLEELGPYSFAGCASLKEIKFTKSDVPFCLGNYAFYRCSSLTSTSFLMKRPNFGRTVDYTTTEYVRDENGDIQYDENGQPLTEESVYYKPAFGDACFRQSGITLLEYPIENVDKLPAYCFAETGITSLKGIGPSILGILYLTELGEYCFYGCSKLDDISDLKSTGVSKLPTGCFSGCGQLSSLDGIDEIGVLGERCFENCTSLTSISHLYIANKIVSIPAYCFSGCTSLTNLSGIDVLPYRREKGITNFGVGAFKNCSAIDDISALSRAYEVEITDDSGDDVLDNEQTRIYLSELPDECFYGCISIKTLFGCQNIERIGAKTFAQCTGLISPSGLGESISYIGDNAFSYCVGLLYFSCLASRVPQIAETAFTGVETSSLYLYVRKGYESNYMNDAVWSKFNVASRTITIRYEDISEITDEVATHTNVVARIGTGDNRIDGIWYVDYGDGSHFETHTNTTLNSHKYNSVGGYDITLFGDIDSLSGSAGESTTTSFSEDVEPELTNRMFLAGLNSNAKSITIESNYFSSIGAYCFANYGLEGEALSVQMLMSEDSTIGNYAFAKDNSLREFGALGEVLVCNAVSIGIGSFYRSGLTSSSAFSTVMTSGVASFAHNPELKSIDGFAKLTEVAPYMFLDCTGLTSTNGLKPVVAIREYAFSGCSGLETVRDFGAGFSSIDSNAFAGCDGIKNIFIALDEPPDLAENGFTENVFRTATVYVPAGSEGSYEVKQYWDKFCIEGREGIISRSLTLTFSGIRNGDLFKGGFTVESLGDWTISYGNTIKRYAPGDVVDDFYFRNISNADENTTVKLSGPIIRLSCSETNYPIGGARIASKLTAIDSSPAMEINSLGDYLFAGCTNLESVTGTVGISTLGDSVFKGDVRLSDISGLTNVSTIGPRAFAGCTSLTSPYPMSNVSIIGAEAFRGAGLTHIDGLGMYVSEIGANAFDSCPLQEVQIFAEEAPVLGTDVFANVEIGTIPLYVRTKSISNYRENVAWNQFYDIRSRYVEFSLTGIPAGATIRGDCGLIKSNTFCVVEWDSASADGIPCTEGEQIELPSHTYDAAGNRTIRIEGDIKEISGKIIDAESEVVGVSFITIDGQDNSLTTVKKSTYSNLEIIGPCTFYKNSSLSTTDLYGIRKVQEYAFSESGIDSLGMLQGVEEIGDYAFYRCSGITSVQNLRRDGFTIGSLAFGEIGPDGTEIYPKYIQVLVQDATQAEIQADSFGDYSPEDKKKINVYVPMGAIGEYRVATNWKEFTIGSQIISFTLENIPDGLNIIGKSSTETVGTARIVSDSEWTIDWGDGSQDTMSKEETTFPSHTYAYSETNQSYWKTDIVDGVTTRYIPRAIITINGSIKSIGCQSVNDSPMITTARGVGNPYLKKVEASSSLQELTEIGPYTFQGSTNLSSVSGFVHVERIGQQAFQGCSSLVGVGDQESGFSEVLTIGDQAFADCTSLSSLVGFPKVATIGIRSFANCISLMSTYGLGSGYAGKPPEECPDNLMFSAYAFEGCVFGVIEMDYARPPSITLTTFPGSPDDVMVYTPPGYLEAYKNADVWELYWEKGNMISSSTITISFGEHAIGQEIGGVKYNAVYGGNGRMIFSGTAVNIDWGDGTSTTSSIETTEGEGWTFPSHIYDESKTPSKVTIRVRGHISQLNVHDKNYPFLALAPSNTQELEDGSIITSLGEQRYYRAKIDTLSFGEGSYLEVVGESLFRGCNISQVHIGKPVDDNSGDTENSSRRISIGRRVFIGCDNLNKVDIDNNAVSIIGAEAFKNCTSLLSTMFLSTCTTILDGAFEGCVGLANTDGLSETVEIGTGAFRGCTGLTSIKIPATVTSVGDYAFFGCNGIIQEAGISWQQATEAQNIQAAIGISAFEGCTGPNNVNWIISIPSQVKYISRRAFFGCGENRISISGSPVAIGEYAFADNKTLSTVNWQPDNTEMPTTIGKGCFEGCSSLQNVVTFGYVTALPDYCFFGCNSLTDISEVLKNAAGTIGQYCFAGCYSITNTVRIPAGITALGEGCFNCSSEKFLRGYIYKDTTEGDYDYSAGSSYISIAEFDDWINAEFFKSPRQDIWNEYNDYLKYDVSSSQTTSFTIDWTAANEVTTIGAGCFMNCTGLVTTDLPNSITSIPNYCFYNCASLTNHGNLSFLPNGCRSIGKFALALTDIKYLNRGSGTGAKPRISAVLSPAAFFECDSLSTLGNTTDGLISIIATTPAALPDACFYGNSSLYDISALSDAVPVTRIGNYCFKNCDGLVTDTDMSLSQNLIYVGDEAFANCGSLRHIPLFPPTEVTLGRGIFKDCTSLLSAVGLPFVKNLPNETFSGCESLNALSSSRYQFPKTIEHLGDECFKDCKNLSNLDSIGSNINSIGVGCFEGCSSPSFKTFNGFPFVYDYLPDCFAGCTNLTTIGGLSSPSVANIFNPELQPTGNLYSDNSISFNPRAIGIQNGWAITQITLQTRTDTSTDWDVGYYRIGVYYGSKLLCVSNAVNIQSTNTVYTFEFGEAQRFAEYANSIYSLKLISQSSYATRKIALATCNTATSIPPFYIDGFSAPWVQPIMTVSYSTDNGPKLYGNAFGECPNISTIDLSDYSSVVWVQKSTDESKPSDPFPDIPIDSASGKKNSTVIVPDNLVDSYKQDEYWGGFLNIVGSGYVPPVIEDQTIVLNMNVPAEGGTIYGNGFVIREPQGSVIIDWGDGFIEDITPSGDALNISLSSLSHTYSATGSVRRLSLRLCGDIVEAFGTADNSTSSVLANKTVVPIFYTAVTATTTDDQPRLAENTWVTTLSVEGRKITSIGGSCFGYFTNLERVEKKFPNTVTTIGNNAFFGDTALVSLDFIPDESLSSLGNYCFAYCPNLRGIGDTISLCSITTIPPGCFCNSANAPLRFDALDWLPTTIESIGMAAFLHVEFATFDLRYIQGPIKIGNYAFRYNYALESLANIRMNLTGTNAFRDCTSLRTTEGMDILSTNTMLPSGTFKGCTALGSLSYLPVTLTGLGDGSFAGTGLTELDFPDGCQISTIGSAEPWSEDWDSQSGGVFSGCTSLDDISGLSKLNALSSLGTAVFRGCKNITRLGDTQNSMPSSILSIGEYCFSNTGLTDLDYISPSIRYIGKHCFDGCVGMGDISGIETLVNIETLPEGCFQNCTSLKAIVEDEDGQTPKALPSNITRIGIGCFKGCQKIKSIRFGRWTQAGEDRITNLNDTNENPSCFDYASLLAIPEFTIYVPYGSKDAYKAVLCEPNRFGDYENIVEY